MKNEKKEYIERGALIDSFDNCYYLYNSAVRETVRQALKNAPAADVAPVVHGEWINRMNGNATCSVCGLRSKAVYDLDNEQHYCGHCGAKMDGGNANDKT